MDELTDACANHTSGDNPDWFTALALPGTRLESLPLLHRLMCARLVAGLHARGASVSMLLRFCLADELVDTLDQRAFECALEPALVTSRVELRPPLHADLESLWKSWASPTIGPLWRGRGSMPAWDEFPSELWAGVDSQMIVEFEGEPQGLVVCYARNPVQQYAHFGFCGLDGARDEPGLIFDGALAMIQGLFENRPFRKLILEVPSYNAWLVDGLPGSNPACKATLRDHVFAKGRWWDVHLIEVWREEWDVFVRPLLRDPKEVVEELLVMRKEQLV